MKAARIENRRCVRNAHVRVNELFCVEKDSTSIHLLILLAKFIGLVCRLSSIVSGCWILKCRAKTKTKARRHQICDWEWKRLHTHTRTQNKNSEHLAITTTRVYFMNKIMRTLQHYKLHIFINSSHHFVSLSSISHYTLQSVSTCPEISFLFVNLTQKLLILIIYIEMCAYTLGSGFDFKVILSISCFVYPPPQNLIH